ncbi:MAG: PASTA domain-containing protein [Actinobacteria bacterium]|nr:PASTA domain-containing protein [Actinomycetota bacterium]
MSELLAGRYRLGDILGRGGSADVYAAHDELLDRPVAVKWARVAADDSVRVQAVAAARLVHPRIVRVLDLGSTGGCDWAVLDLVEGLSARELLRQGCGPTAADAVAALVGVLEGLGYLHGQGVRHLDVSPGNLLVPTAAGRPCWAQVRLTDLAAPVEVGGRVVVSPHYVAPEVARGQPGDERADLYSAGATLMHLLTGAPPFDRDDPAQLLVAHVNDLVEPPSSRLPGLPRVLDEIVLTALAKAPADRYPDAGAMGRALRAVDLDPRPTAPAATVVRRPSPAFDGHTRPMQAARPAAEAAAPAAAWMPSSRPAQVQSPHPVRPARAVPVGALLLALVAVGVGTGVALGRPAGASAMPTGAGTVTSAAAVVDQLPSAPATSSVPPATVAVPVLVGSGLEAARAELEAVGLVLGEVGTVDGPSAAGAVLTSDPAQAAQVAPGTVVTVVVASGWTTVPALAGLAPAAVDEALAAAGLAAEVVGGATGGAPGAVTGSQPAAGARVEVGSRVRLVVADRPSVPAFTASATPTPTTPGTPVPSATPTATPTPG